MARRVANQGQSGHFISPDVEFRQSVPAEGLGQRDIGGIAAARDQDSRKPRLVVPRVEYLSFTSEKDLHPCGKIPGRLHEPEVRNVSLLAAIGVTTDGYRAILGIVEDPKEDKCGGSMFLRHLTDPGLSGVQLIVSDACRGLVNSAADARPDAPWQRRVVHVYRNVLSVIRVHIGGNVDQPDFL